MKLIRHGAPGREKPGVLLADGTRLDVSRWLGSDYDESFFANGALAELDAWLRAEGNRRNPGTTADLVTACLFIALREGSITLPPSVPFSAGEDHG